MIKTPLNLYQQIEQYLIDYIKTRNLQPGDRLPPEREIGQQFGASHVPVRQAIDALVAKGTVKRIHGKGAFVKMSGNGTVRTNTIAVLYWPDDVSFYLSPHYNALTSGMKLEAERREKLLMYRSLTPVFKNGTLPAAITEMAGNVDGFLVTEMPVEMHKDILPALAKTGKPAVVITDNFVPNTVDAVVFDHSGNARLMAEFLKDQGHRRVAFLSQKSKFFDMKMYYHKSVLAIRETFGSGNTVSRILARDTATDLETVKGLLNGPTAPTALICNTDETAFYMLRIVQELGLAVPDDVSITGYDDLIESRYSTMDFTTIRLPFMEVGRIGIKRLLEQVDSVPDSITSPCRIALAGELIARNSHKTLQ